jgi:uncharacterized protein (TIGR03083 family)
MLPDAAAAGPAFRGVRERVSDLLAGSSEVAETPVPACPEWTVREVVAHMVGACEDVLAGNLEGVASEAWTDAQVARHADDELTSLLGLWAEIGPQLDEVTPLFPKPSAAQFVFDATTHEHDLRAALDQPGARGSEGVRIGAAFLAGGLVRGGAADGLPPLRVETEDAVYEIGEGAAVVLRASPFELLRGLGGRRSMDQIAAMDWQGDPAPYLRRIAAGTTLRPPASDLIE